MPATVRCLLMASRKALEPLHGASDAIEHLSGLAEHGAEGEHDARHGFCGKSRGGWRPGRGETGRGRSIAPSAVRAFPPNERKKEGPRAQRGRRARETRGSRASTRGTPPRARFPRLTRRGRGFRGREDALAALPRLQKSSSRPRCGQGSRFAGQIRVGRGARRARERARVRGSTHLRLVSFVRRSCTSRGAEAERAEVVRAPRCATPTSPTKHSSCWARTKCKTPEPVTCGSGRAVCENILGFTTRRFAPTPRTGGIRTIFSEIFHPRASSVVRTRGSVTSAKCAHARGDRRFAREVEDDGGCHRVRGRDGVRTLVRGRGRVRRVGRVRRARGARGCR